MGWSVEQTRAEMARTITETPGGAVRVQVTLTGDYPSGGPWMVGQVPVGTEAHPDQGMHLAAAAIVEEFIKHCRRRKIARDKADGDKLSAYAAAGQEYLIGRCRAAFEAGDPFTATVTTADLVNAIDPGHEQFKAPRWNGIRQQVLDPIAAADHAAGRPRLTSLVRQPKGWAPTPGFWTNARGIENAPDVPEDERTAYWESQITAAVEAWGNPAAAADEAA